MKQLIYSSEPFGFDSAMLAGILVRSREKNREADITGALICRHDMYLQLIEGPEAAIDAVFARIVKDDRHLAVKVLLSRTADQRMFPEWEMLDDQMPSLTWSAADVAGGIVETATPEMLLGVFERVAAKARIAAA
ncbi:BLUF domain-containing protein [Novosphingobium sp. Chol11]|uniref:BLUF domain-containing protein n=1 Tax=Novosphingobium sp. Chol11 TaxID=1385763 RepID=UPI0025FFD7B8|nr:BLUF domain-containing protein [Novosphingobium sp. Chol11]